jgi:hypothetical protein
MTLTISEDRPAAAVPDTMPLVFEAIVKQQAIAASYNRGSVTLAPHIVYTKHGEIYLDALTLERDGQPPRSSADDGEGLLAGHSPPMRCASGPRTSSTRFRICRTAPDCRSGITRRGSHFSR